MSGARELKARVDTTVAAVAGITVVGFALRLAVLLRPIGVVDKLYIRDRDIGWLADFDLHLVGFAFAESQELVPKPTLTGIPNVQQFPPFPHYGVGRINWPPGSGVPSP